MASNKAKLLEQALLEEIHPFAARRVNDPPQQPQPSPPPREASMEAVRADISAPTQQTDQVPTLPEIEHDKIDKEELQLAQPSSPTPTNEQTHEVTNVRTNARFMERQKIRHTFDIFADQLLSLREITLDREKMFGDRVLLGDLVQEALDLFITKEGNKE